MASVTLYFEGPLLKDGTRAFPVKMRRGRVGKMSPKQLWLKVRKSQAVPLKQKRPNSIGVPAAFGVQIKRHGIVTFKMKRALVFKATHENLTFKP